MSSKSTERDSAIEAADHTCPRCGAQREFDQKYCLECGLALPTVAGRVSGLRRRWLRRLGWYPGDWVWASLLMLLVAAVGTASAIAFTRHDASAKSLGYSTSPLPVATVREPTAIPTTNSLTGDTSTLPVAPEPTTTASAAPRPVNGRLAWPADRNGWTIVLVSYPKTNGLPSARATAARAAKANLPRVGILDSSGFASLQPGYFVVFTGIYGTKTEADGSVSTARQAGFSGAYSRQISR
ncbi:MAG: zinc ribbon domain-containing protein [Actinobacteria bacterium]|nr:zinc ribbon domain-containing protein [Actinomycetota bacterium]